jgi:threonine/homoserine/homoserine lactone efflux protein
MNDHRCCEVAASVSGGPSMIKRSENGHPARSEFFRGFFDVAGCVVSSVILALLPKCPVCFAAYVAIGTGVGLSVSTAAVLRMFLLILCGGSLVYLAVKLLWSTNLSSISNDPSKRRSE